MTAVGDGFDHAFYQYLAQIDDREFESTQWFNGHRASYWTRRTRSLLEREKSRNSIGGVVP